MPTWRRAASVSGFLICAAGATGYVMLYSGNPWLYKHVLMGVAARLDPERAHALAVYLAAKGFVPRDRTRDPKILHVSLWGKGFPNPVGLAAGFDKHAEAYPALLRCGFGFMEVGSVTPLPQPGNSKPRVFRLHQDRAVINRYGFNSHGCEVVRERLIIARGRREGKEDEQRLKEGEGGGKILGVNLGKNKESPSPVGDYVKGLRSLGEFADYVVINVSSPNTPGLRNLQRRQELAGLLDQVILERDALPNRPPLLVKIAPDLSHEEKEDIAAVITREKGGVDGLIVSNTTLSRPGSLLSIHKSEAGGLSGSPLRQLSTAAISDMYELTGGKVPIIGVGGISSGRDAYDKILAGASLVQLYTALAYEGPPIVKRIKKELADILRSNGYSSVSEAVGATHRRAQTKPSVKDL